jgi:hypothetical protein
MKQLSALLVPMLIASSPSYACRSQMPLTQKQMDKADVIFIGRVVTIGVPACSGSCNGQEKGHHSIIFNVEKVIKGKSLDGQIEAYWQNGMFGEVDSPDEFRKKYGMRSRVGIILPATIKNHVHCGSKTKAPGCTTDLPLPFLPQTNSSFDKPWILSEVCSPAFIFRVD